MQCPYCNEELKYHDWYYTGNHAAYQKGYEESGFKKLGDIYICPNRDGFDNDENADPCESAIFNGFFHTDPEGNIKEGHPC